mgnify:CR=1 FL=1
MRKINRKGTDGSAGLTRSLRIMLPTMGATEEKGTVKNRYVGSPNFRGSRTAEGLRTSSKDPIYLNPSFAEAIMGFPIGWTELSASETPSSRRARKQSQEE